MKYILKISIVLFLSTNSMADYMYKSQLHFDSGSIRFTSNPSSPSDPTNFLCDTYVGDGHLIAQCVDGNLNGTLDGELIEGSCENNNFQFAYDDELLYGSCT